MQTLYTNLSWSKNYYIVVGYKRELKYSPPKVVRNLKKQGLPKASHICATRNFSFIATVATNRDSEIGLRCNPTKFNAATATLLSIHCNFVINPTRSDSLSGTLCRIALATHKEGITKQAVGSLETQRPLIGAPTTFIAQTEFYGLKRVDVGPLAKEKTNRSCLFFQPPMQLRKAFISRQGFSTRANLVEKTEASSFEDNKVVAPCNEAVPMPVSTETHNVDTVRSRIESHYKQIIIQDLLLKQNIQNLFEIPKITKIICHWSSGAVLQDKKILVNAIAALQLLTGQKPHLIFAKKSVATFKVRKKQLIGCKVTLRGEGLYFFLENLVNVVFPRLSEADIQNLQSSAKHLLAKQANKSQSQCGAFSKSNKNSAKQNKETSLLFSQLACGNKGEQHYSIGLKHLLLFPQIESQLEFFEILKGLDVIISTKSSSNIDGLFSILLSGFQLPF